MFSSRPRHSSAFTLLELIVVIVVLGILAALAIPTFAAVIDRSRTETAVAGAESVGREALALGSFEGESPLLDDAEHLQAALLDSDDVQLDTSSVDLAAGTAVVTVGEGDVRVLLTFSGTSVAGAPAPAGVASQPGPPAPPALVSPAWATATISGSTVTVSWAPVSGATGYKVVKGRFGETQTPPASATSTTFEFSPGESFNFSVWTLDGASQSWAPAVSNTVSY